MSNVHKNDPKTSSDAFEEFEESGQKQTHINKVVDEMMRRPGSTAAEIAVGCGLTHVQTQRRLSDLKTSGLVRMQGERECRVNGRNMSLWWIV